MALLFNWIASFVIRTRNDDGDERRSRNDDDTTPSLRPALKC